MKTFRVEMMDGFVDKVSASSADDAATVAVQNAISLVGLWPMSPRERSLAVSVYSVELIEV